MTDEPQTLPLPEEPELAIEQVEREPTEHEKIMLAYHRMLIKVEAMINRRRHG